MKPPIPTEDVEQIAVADWLRANKIFFHHANRKGQRLVQHIMKEERLGSQKGFPDLLIFDPPITCVGKVGVAIEMKRKKGGKVSPEQTLILEKLKTRNWETAVCCGADEAISLLKSLGYGRRNRS